MAKCLIVIALLVPIIVTHTAEGGNTPSVIERVSVATDGTDPFGDSEQPSLSSDGRFVAFSSDAPNLVPDDANYVCDNDGDGTASENCRDVFVYDRALNETERISVSSDGGNADADSGTPKISADGRFIAFLSRATNIAEDSDGPFGSTLDAFLHNRETGATEMVSVGTSGKSSTAHVTDLALSPNGRYVAFPTYDSLSPADTNGTGDIYRRDLMSKTTVLASIEAGSALGGPSNSPSVDDNGDVAFFLFANIPPIMLNTIPALYVYDSEEAAASVVSLDPAEPLEMGYGSYPAMSGDGRYIAFLSGAANLPDTAYVDLFVYDRMGRTVEPVSFNDLGEGANGRVSIARNTEVTPAITYDGRFVAFSSAADNIVTGDSNNCVDVFVRDMDSDETRRIGVGVGGAPSDGDSGFVALSGGGQIVAFDSRARNLTESDTNGDSDVFTRERSGNPVETSGGATGNGCDLSPGDADCDYQLTSADALQVLRFTANLRPWGECVREVGNVNCDLSFAVDAIDGLTILRAIAGLGVVRNPEDCFHRSPDP